MGLLNKLLRKKENARPTPPPIPDPEPKEMDLEINVTDRLRKAQASLLSENPYYGLKMNELVKLGKTDTRIYRYKWGRFFGILLPDPEKYDPDALKIEVAGVTVGRVTQDDTEIVKLMKADRIEAVKVSIHGGPWKLIEKGDNGRWHAVKEDRNVYMEVKLVLK